MRVLSSALLCGIFLVAGCKNPTDGSMASRKNTTTDLDKELKRLGQTSTESKPYRVLTTSAQCRKSNDKSCPSEEMLANNLEEGSGTWGAIRKERAPTDYLAHAVFSRMADTAEFGFKYKMAAKHLRHYLKNTGVTRFLDDEDIQEVMKTDAMVTAIKDTQDILRATIGSELAALPQSERIPGKKVRALWDLGVYFDEADVFYAIGGATIVTIADATISSITNDVMRIHIALDMVLKDDYNWDNGKSADVLDDWCKAGWCKGIQDFTKLRVQDKDLGRLHKVGLAHEFQVRALLPRRTYVLQFSQADVNRLGPVWRNVLECIETGRQCPAWFGSK